MKIPKSGKVYLTAREVALSTPELRALLRSQGFEVNKVTLSRIRTGKQTWFLTDRGVGRRANLGFVRLSREEREMSRQDLAEHLGVSPETADRAKRRGWFEVTTTNVANLKIDPARIEQGDLPRSK